MEQLLNGRFEYEVPHLLLSETEVALTLDEGQNFRGELNIGAEDGRRVKGIVTTDHQRIVLAKNQFQGTASTIEYGVDTSGLKAGDEICGNITVSSNLEERCVRVHVSIAGKTMNISGQEIHSLADFVHLASHDFGAAYRFFVKKRVCTSSSERGTGADGTLSGTVPQAGDISASGGISGCPRSERAGDAFGGTAGENCAYRGPAAQGNTVSV